MAETQVDVIEHGTLTAYSKRGCRCDACRLFWNAYMRWWRVEQRGRTHPCPTCSCPRPEKPAAHTEPAPCETCGWTDGHNPKSVACQVIRPAEGGGDRG